MPESRHRPSDFRSPSTVSASHASPVIPTPQRRIHAHLTRHILDRDLGYLPRVAREPGLNREKFQDQRKAQPRVAPVLLPTHRQSSSSNVHEAIRSSGSHSRRTPRTPHPIQPGNTEASTLDGLHGHPFSALPFRVAQLLSYGRSAISAHQNISTVRMSHHYCSNVGTRLVEAPWSCVHVLLNSSAGRGYPEIARGAGPGSAVRGIGLNRTARPESSRFRSSLRDDGAA